jgi:hypothetical protein
VTWSSLIPFALGCALSFALGVREGGRTSRVLNREVIKEGVVVTLTRHRKRMLGAGRYDCASCMNKMIADTRRSVVRFTGGESDAE